MKFKKELKICNKNLSSEQTPATKLMYATTAQALAIIASPTHKPPVNQAPVSQSAASQPPLALPYQQASEPPLLGKIAKSGNQKRQFPQSQIWEELLPKLGA
ncbi:hypothetical protein DSO57_1024290 [Entomophthora muscae]|uniref:Uncharacterized protein n=1 Tax=Entomophthora muscae TaxID=34485 RepID=A0ACC2TQ51_9FUNG|nr:hypothetical protein DSO57_1024290 [Entomophthora muscae]